MTPDSAALMLAMTFRVSSFRIGRTLSNASIPRALRGRGCNQGKDK
jgi:hypothetical protein